MALALNDDAVLHAALAFIDSFSGQQKPQQVRLSSTQRIATQLKSLREEAATLQDQLAALSTTRIGRHGPHDSDWANLAQCQKERRGRAKVENARLRARVTAQVRLARRLAHAVSRAAHMQPTTPRPLGSFRRLDLAGEAMQMCKEASTIFSKSPFVSPSTLPQGIVTRRATPQGPVVELMDSRVVPFDMHMTGEALWYHLAHHQTPGEMILNKGGVSALVLERELRFRLTSDGPSQFHSKIAARRVAPSSSAGAMITWALEIQAEVQDESQSLARYSTSEKIWTLVQPVTLDPSNPSKVASLVQMYMITSPSSYHPGGPLKVLHLDHHIGSIQAHLEEQWAHVESLLLNPSWVAKHQPETF